MDLKSKKETTLSTPNHNPPRPRKTNDILRIYSAEGAQLTDIKEGERVCGGHSCGVTMVPIQRCSTLTDGYGLSLLESYRDTLVVEHPESRCTQNFTSNPFCPNLCPLLQ
eukprot:TRINITY_DN141_c0_g2_i3.p2 TRINITY_DN141_c0_g2~~TRINITY_DN141_c0_g2_i3.p2  ORF type:complete len:110 (-),score=0.87 TRINITY_DN141_c0_g2_i3:905-1234(-)